MSADHPEANNPTQSTPPEGRSRRKRRNKRPHQSPDGQPAAQPQAQAAAPQGPADTSAADANKDRNRRKKRRGGRDNADKRQGPSAPQRDGRETERRPQRDARPDARTRDEATSSEGNAGTPAAERSRPNRDRQRERSLTAHQKRPDALRQSGTRPGPKPQGPNRPRKDKALPVRWSVQPPQPTDVATPEPPPRAPTAPVFLPPPAEPQPIDEDTALDLTPWEADIDQGDADGTLYNVVTVRTARSGRPREYDAGDAQLEKGDLVAVEGESTPGTVLCGCQRQMCRGRLPRVVRRVTDPEAPDNRARRRETEVFRIARHIAHTLGLPIKVVRAEADASGKTVVYFASEERIDFRELFRRVSAAAQGRIELRQIGVRDAAKMMGGVGPCGQQLCCSSFLREFAPVSIKMAKDQGLVLNPHRVSGLCGRLLCCLTYEDELYRTQRKLLPKLGKRVITPRGPGKVRDVDVLAQVIRVALEGGDIVSFSPGELTPMFPSQRRGGPDAHDESDGAEDAGDEQTEDDLEETQGATEEAPQ